MTYLAYHDLPDNTMNIDANIHKFLTAASHKGKCEKH